MSPEITAVVLDYGHTIVDFGRTEEALLHAYREIRERIEAALEIEAPEVGHLIDRVAGEVDRLVRISYEARRHRCPGAGEAPRPGAVLERGRGAKARPAHLPGDVGAARRRSRERRLRRRSDPRRHRRRERRGHASRAHPRVPAGAARGDHA